MLKVVAASDVVITTAADPGQAGAHPAHRRDGRGHAAGLGDRRSRRRARRQLRADPAPTRWSSHHGVTILGPSNLPALVPYHASQMYSKNITTFLDAPARQGRRAQPQLPLNLDDEITRETLADARRRRRPSRASPEL